MNIVSQGTVITVTFDVPLLPQNAADPASYVLSSPDGGVPLIVLEVEVAGLLSVSSSIEGSSAMQLQPASSVFYASGAIASRYLEISQVVLRTTKPSAGHMYRLATRGLKMVNGNVHREVQTFVASASLPRVTRAEQLEDGVVVTYSERMRINDSFISSDVYAISGPTEVMITSVRVLSASKVLLTTVGLRTGLYTLRVSGVVDVAANPLDAPHDVVQFTAIPARHLRSIFTDRGPIAKPALTLQSGAGASIASPTQITLPGANVTAGHVGLYVSLTGGPNEGAYRVTSRVSATVVKVAASFSHLDDPSNGALGWSLIDYRDGQIANDPTDVVVKINDTPVEAEAVIGLLGQVVLPLVPEPDDDVRIDYAWIRDPVVDVRRLNSKEFCLNNWNKRVDSASSHQYRYNNTLLRPEALSRESSEAITGIATFPTSVILSDLSANFSSVAPESYVTMLSGPNKGLRRKVHAILSDTRLTLEAPLFDSSGGAYRVDPIDISAGRSQPLERDLKYRAYERAYSVALNDPNLLLLNSPNQRIAYPPMSRPLATVFVNYEGSVLPEASADPWQRAGQGLAEVQGADLVVVDDSIGPAPGGAPIFWTRPIDLTFDHIYALAWRMRIDATPTPQGVFTGLAAGYADAENVCVVGYLDVEGVKMLGVLRKGFGNDPSQQAAWTSAELDWSISRSYRLFRDQTGSIGVYVDGAVVPMLQAAEDSLPSLHELNAPFDQLQGPFFGSISREAASTSTWSFVRYTAIPANPLESEPSIFVAYEGSQVPEAAAQPWTPVGFHGTEHVVDSHLVLDSTSASSGASGLISGDFKGYTRIEPLLKESFSTVLDLRLAVRTYTHGMSPNAVMAAIDDGDRLIQLSFVAEQASPKISYGGRTLPPEFEPYPWNPTGAQAATMVGQYLMIEDESTEDGLSYTAQDSHATDSADRVISYLSDYMVEFRVRVVSYTPDVTGFCGVSSSVYDGLQSVGLQLVQHPEYVEQDGGIVETNRRYVELHSEGVGRPGGRFAFEWNDGMFHTYRLTKSTLGSQVSVFADGVYLGALDYQGFEPPPAPSLVGRASFGSATALSVQARSVAVWAYSNYWRVTSGRRFVGLWKGYDSDALTGYHLPASATGHLAWVNGNVLTDTRVDFVALGVAQGDQLIIDEGANKGVYTVDVVAPLSDVSKLTVLTQFRSQPTQVSYRCVKEVDWTTEHRYRIIKDPSGGVAVFLDDVDQPLIHTAYGATSLPPSSVGILQGISAGLSSITWGAFDPTNLSQTSWDYVRFGAIRSLSASGIAPHHQILNQVNVMASYEHHRFAVPHQHTDFWSSGEGIPPQTEPDLLQDPNLIAYTLLNEGTPLVPSTQTYQVRAPKSLVVSVADLDDPQEVLNHRGFLVNQSSERVEVQVPDDVLYNSLQVLERSTGEADLIAPFDDDADIHALSELGFKSEVCLSYDGTVLPENDTTAPVRWVRASDNDAKQVSTVSAGALTYRADGTRTVYRNGTPLPLMTSLPTEVKFRVRLMQDATEGLGDTQVRFGFSSPGATVGLAFVTTAAGERYVLVVDMNNRQTLAGIPFDFSDGSYHTYVIRRDPASASIQIRVEP